MGIPAVQGEVAAFLEAQAGRPPIETHISAVFVGADTAWKLKKAVRLAFLDFTPLDARRHFLERELALNGAAAPGIYRDVVAIGRGADGALAFGPAEADRAPLDWVLRMAPVDPADFLHAIIDRGAFTTALAVQLGDCVAGDHARRPVVRPWDSAAHLHAVTEAAVQAAGAAGLPAPEVAAWARAMHEGLDRLGPALGARAAAGHVRRCHGDLHAGNICLWRGAPVPFDALEFDETYATIDTGYDLAFLLMDLDHWVGRDAANAVFNRYLAVTGDLGAACFMPLFMSLRALVRAHVEAASGHGAAARAYLARAGDYQAPAIATVLAIGGLPGTGKSTLARRMAPALGPAPGAVVLRSDEIRKRHFGVKPEAKLPQAAYAEAVNADIAAQLVAGVRAVAAAGHAVIADAMFLDKGARAAVQAAAGAAPFTGLWLTAPMAVLRARVAARRGDASDADVTVLEAVASADPGRMDWAVVDFTAAEDAVRAALTEKPAGADPAGCAGAAAAG
jgi:aminoglycoside phosphotransferase family enzyme/predicted kinase